MNFRLRTLRLARGLSSTGRGFSAAVDEVDGRACGRPVATGCDFEPMRSKPLLNGTGDFLFILDDKNPHPFSDTPYAIPLHGGMDGLTEAKVT